MRPDEIRNAVKTLLDVRGLEGLRDVCAKHRVSLVCHGGTPRRIAIAVLESEVDEESWSIFDCVPFSSDIDLVHSGTPAQTPAIYHDIHACVPFAEQFRWELRSSDEQEVFDRAKTYAPIVPACLIELSTHEGWIDPWNGLDDLATGTLRLIRNHYYQKSPRFLAGDDVEMLGVLLYYKAILERPLSEPDNDGIKDAGQILKETVRHIPSVTRLQENAYLRSRLRYLLTSVKALGGVDLVPESQQFRKWGLHHIGDVIVGLGGEDELRAILEWGPDAGHLTVSNRLGGDRYRLPAIERNEWTSGDFASAAMSKVTLAGHVTRAITLADDQTLLLGSPLMQCAPGVSPSSARSEFVHFTVRAEAPIEADSSDLAVLCTIGLNPNTAALVAVPTMCTPMAGGDGRSIAVRCNLGNALNTRDSEEGRTLQVFITQLQHREARLWS